MVVSPSGAEKKLMVVLTVLPKDAVPVGTVVDQLAGSCQSLLALPVQVAFWAYAAVAPSNVLASAAAATRRNEPDPTTNPRRAPQPPSASRLRMAEFQGTPTDRRIGCGTPGFPARCLI